MFDRRIKMKSPILYFVYTRVIPLAVGIFVIYLFFFKTADQASKEASVEREAAAYHQQHMQPRQPKIHHPLEHQSDDIVRPKGQEKSLTSFYNSDRIAKTEYEALPWIRNRQRHVESLKRAINTQYIEKMRKALRETDSKVQFITFETRSIHNCGFGDNIKGLVSAFYLALHTGRVLHIDWDNEGLLGDYFDIDAPIYRVMQDEYSYHLNHALDRGRQASAMVNYADSGSESEFLQWTSSKDLVGELKDFDNVVLRANSLVAITGTLKNPFFKDNYEQLLDSLVHTEALDLSVFVSAALRILFGRPKTKLTETFSKCFVEAINNTEYWTASYQIGVQMRSLDPSTEEKDMECYLEKLATTVDEVTNDGMSSSFAVFLASDLAGALPYLEEHFAKNSKDVLVIDSGKYCPELVPSANTSQSSADPEDSWLHFAKVYLDWLAFTQMDHLIIGQSGLGETASLFSLKTTDQFVGDQDQQKCSFREFNVIGSNLGSIIDHE